MSEQNVKQPSRVWRTVRRVLAWGAAALVVAVVIAHFAWKYSGSNTWQQTINQRGVTVYTKKIPGETLLRIRAVTHVKTSLSRAVAAMVSTDTEDCSEWAPGCSSEKVVKPFNAADLSYTHLYRLTYPRPFTVREFLIHAQVTQDQPTKSVLVAFNAWPNELPPNSCCVRVETLHNTWRFTPVSNGQVEVEATMDTDQKVPYFLVNKVAPRGIYLVCRHLQKFLNKPKWQNAKVARIVEQ